MAKNILSRLLGIDNSKISRMDLYCSTKVLGLKQFILLSLLRLSVRFGRSGYFFRIKACKRSKSYLIKKYGSYIDKNLKNYLSKTNIKETNSETIPDITWILWWQGLDSAPDIILQCINSVRKYRKNVIIIDKYNYKKYSKLPDFIIDKFDANGMSITNLSDIMRVELLSRHGGFWFDATCFLIEPVPDKFINYEFYTARFPNSYYWSGYYIGGKKNNLVTTLLYEALKDYWKKENYQCDYHLLDLFYEIYYEKCIPFRELIDNIPINNQDITFFYLNAKKEISEKKYKDIIKENNVFKLSWKGEFKNLIKGSYGYQFFCDFINKK